MSQILEFVAVVVKNLPYVDETTMQGWIENPGALQKALQSALVPPQNNKITLVVDYGRSLKDSITAGHYDYTDSDITEENFGKHERQFTLYHFGNYTESDWVIAQMEKDGKRPATLPELLAFGEANPELQRQFPIIALGSVWVDRGGDRFVPFLRKYDSERELGSEWYGRSWGDDCRFLAVSK